MYQRRSRSLASSRPAPLTAPRRAAAASQPLALTPRRVYPAKVTGHWHDSTQSHEAGDGHALCELSATLFRWLGLGAPGTGSGSAPARTPRHVPLAWRRHRFVATEWTGFPQSPPAGSPCLAGRHRGVHWQQQPLAPVRPGPAASEGGRCQRSSGTDKFGIATLGRYTRILLRKYCRKQTAALRYRRPSQTASRVIQFCAVTSTTTAPWGTQCAECMHEQGDRDNGNTANYDQPDGGPASEAANGSSALQGAGVGGGNTKS